MKLGHTTQLLFAAAVACSLFLNSVSAVGDERESTTSVPVDLPPTCLGDLASLSSGRSDEPLKYCMPDRFIEISFKLKFGCDPPTLIDQGVRLEVRLNPIVSQFKLWEPIRYYTPSLTPPSDYKSLVELDYSNNSVIAESFRYNSSLPLLLVNASESIIIKEYICGNHIQNFTSGMKLQLRWMQRFGNSSMEDYASWMLDDISIRIWNGTCFLQVLSEDFGDDSPSSKILLGKAGVPSCRTSGSGNAMLFRGGSSDAVTRRSIIITNWPSDISGSCEETENPIAPDDLTCPINAFTASLESVMLQCHPAGSVQCRCGSEIKVNGVKCEAAPHVTTSNSLLESFNINGTLTLMCGFEGVPLPSLVWMHNGLPLSSSNDSITITTTTSGLSSGTSTLQWVNASTDTVGTFTFVATSYLGSANSSFNVQIQTATHVTTSNSLLESFNINSTLTLMCGFEGVPLPSLVWMHNGLPLSSSNDSITITTTTSGLSSGTSTLQWMNASTDTVGTFTCVATSYLGSANRSFNVQIQTAPHVTTSNSLLESFNINGTLTLMCGFEGVPLPSLVWMHNGLPLSSSNDSITITTTTSGLSSGTSTLQWVNASMDTVGTFTCVATNNLGSANSSFNVQIQTAPHVTTSNSLLESFNINGTLTLMCGFEGVPLPSLVWMHNGLPLSSSNDSITITTTTSGLSSGTSTLQWVNASKDTVGTFTCVATSYLGSANSSFNVQIQTAPHVTTSNSLLESFNINGTLTLMCGFEGVPLPSLVWMHNGLPLSSSNDSITITTTTSGLSSGTSTLQWVNASKDTVGTFTCVATSYLGSANSSFDVQIQTAPHVTTSNSLLESFNINGTLTLMCGFEGVPLPSLVWMHNGLPLSSSNDSITITTTTSGLSSGTSTLQWVNASKDTVGTFTCVATSYLGSANSSFNVQIQTAPHVTTSNSLLEPFNINGTLTLMCGFEGVPLPSLVWMHNGLPLSSSNDSITITTTTSGLSSGTSTLQWVNASKDTVGTFTCVATSYLGSANRSFNVQIQTAPHVTTSNSLLESFNINGTLTLMCGFEGVPLPSLVWMHNGLPLSSSNDSITITTTTSGLSSGTSTLQWVNASTDTVGTFTCVATSYLGSANRSFDVQIQTAPHVTTSNSLLESFNINGTLTLMCGFEGVPLPSLVWMHNGLPLSSSNDSITITTTTSGLSSGTSTLQWVNASKDTVGTFTCVATSYLGSANKSFNVQIRTAPHVTTSNSLLESFNINGTLTLMCGFEGVPLPSLVWMHNGLPLSSSNDSITITTTTSGLSSGTSTLQWVNASTDTVGTFTCVATSYLGSANSSFNVKIQTAPHVTTSNSLLESFNINGTLTLMCGFEGVPLPSLVWKHNGLPLSSSNDSITITTTTSGLSSGTSTLQWVNASKDTVGTFTCVATSYLGSANSSFNVQIQTAPHVTTSNSLLESFNINSTLTLMCGFEGVPLPSLVWMHNGLPLSSSNDSITITTTTSGLSSGTSTLQWVNASTDTVGTFTCVATSYLGSANRSFNVQIETETTTPTAIATTATVTTTMTTPTSVVNMSVVQELVSKLLEDGPSGDGLDILLKLYDGLPLPAAISKVLISSSKKKLTNLAMETDPEAGGRVLEFLDRFALIAYNPSQGKISNDIFTFYVQEVSLEDYMKPEKRLEGLREAEGAISLPGELLSKFPEAKSALRIASFIYKNLSGILPEHTDDNSTNTRMGSPVVSAALGCAKNSCSSSYLELQNPVLVEIHHFNNIGDDEVPGCYYFDLKRNTWSSRGCHRNSALSNSTFSVCECYHLTHFAILLSPRIEGLSVQIGDVDNLVLKVISYVTVPISVLCMVATIFVLGFLKPLRGMRTYIHMNLCICLSISQLLLISAVDQTALEELCLTVAIVLHYFWLTSFMWMLMEGVVLYIVLVHVFIKRKYLYMIGFTVVSYGLPALYVLGVTVPLGLILTDKQGRPQYIQYNISTNVTEACWLRYDTHFIWAFITPVLVIIIANIGFFIMALSIMWKHEKKSNHQSLVKKTCRWLKAAVSLMIVMGMTWTIGLLTFVHVVLAYAFTIAAALQGMCIFILFVLISTQVQDHYRSWWRSKKSESEFFSKLFTSSGIIGWDQSFRGTRSNSYSVTRGRASTLQTQASVTDVPVASVNYSSIQMMDCNGNDYKFDDKADNNDIDHSEKKPEKDSGKDTENHSGEGIDKQSSVADNDYGSNGYSSNGCGTTAEKYVDGDTGHMSNGVSHVTSNHDSKL